MYGFGQNLTHDQVTHTKPPLTVAQRLRLCLSLALTTSTQQNKRLLFPRRIVLKCCGHRSTFQGILTPSDNLKEFFLKFTIIIHSLEWNLLS